jgi:Flp pilus assembly protein TadG
MSLWRERSGVAALELALVAPLFVLLMMFTVDMGMVLLGQAQIARALESSAEYATLAGQNNVATSTIATNALSFARGVSNGFLSAPTVTAVLNNGAATGAKCCPGTAWTCSTAANFACADGSTPGIYLTVTAHYPFMALFPADTFLVGKTLSDSVVALLR